MLDQLRRDIKTRLDDLLREVDKLRQALAALGSRESNTTPSSSSASPKAGSPSRHRARSGPAPSTAPRPRTRSRAAAPSRQPTKAPAKGVQSPAAARSAPGATKIAILAAVAHGDAMTAGEIAAATGLGRATVSTTLSRLAKAGEVAKAARGYQIPSRQRLLP